MAANVTSDVLPRKAKVVAATDFRGVPAGTPGKVVIVNGLSWIRYWVRFENGVSLGSINRKDLVSPDEWRAVQAGELSLGGSAGDGGAAEDGDDAGGGGGGADVVVNGVPVPAKLIERAKAARARLAA